MLLAMLTSKGNRYFCMGYTAVLDEDFDDLSPPPLTMMTALNQFEGTGRNNFGMQIHECSRPAWLVQESVAPAPTVKPEIAKPAIVKPKPTPEPEPPFEPIDPETLSPLRRALYDAIQRAKNRNIAMARPPIRQKLQPLHPFCFTCGYRRGGPESWDFERCRCGIAAGPIISPNGNYFYE